MVTGLLATVPDLDPAEIGDVVWGNANGAGEDNRNVGRMAVLLAGLPVSVPATTVNRLCGSSLDAVIMASRAVESGDADVVLAGGCESMTRAPWVLPEAVPGLSRRGRNGGLDHPGLAAGQPADAGRVDGVPRRGQRAAAGAVRHLPRAAGRVRAALAPAGRRGLDRGVLRQPGDRRAGCRPEAGRGHTRRRVVGGAVRSQAGVPAQRHHHRRERVAAQRRGLRGAGGVRAGRPSSSAGHRWRGSPAGESRP